ncbi:hypothetical protein, partial [Methanoculleus sp.]|uniref:hypothetical protein n=1 Tax=Methanoculleus sp. TaxID=90427 RepID=UPI001BD2CFF6
LDQEFIIYTPVTIVRIRASPAFFRWHEGAGGTSGIFYVWVEGPDLCNTANNGDEDDLLTY